MVDIDGKLKIMGNALFASSLNGSISGINLLKGKAVWAKYFSSSTGVDADPQGLYSSDAKGNIWKFAPQTGQPIWKMDDLMRRQPSTPVLVKPGLLIVADKQGNLHWINATNGQFVARNKGDKAGYSVAPVPDYASANAVYAFGKNGVLSKLNF
jgi:outer membrane protein assembly factor BamB